MKRLLAALALVVGTQAAAVEFPLEIIEYFDRARLAIFATESDIERSPPWVPSEGAPPLSVEGLLQKVREHAARDPRLTGASITRIELKPVLHHEQQHRWYYLVQLSRQADGEPRFHYLAVLLDGQVLSAIREPESYK